MTQATIGRSYAALAAPGEAQPWTEVLRAQLHAIGPDIDDRRAAAFGGLLALGRMDVFAGEKEGSDDEPLKIDLVADFEDYAPVLELAAEQWEELEMATGGLPVSRLSRWTDDPADFWRALVPYLSRSSRLRTRFLEYCDDGSVVLQAPALLALARLVGPESSLLLDCCKRVLRIEFDKQKWMPFDVAHATVVASKCLAAHFCRRRIGFRRDRSGERQTAGAGRRRRWTGVALAGSRDSRSGIPEPSGVTRPARIACLCRSLASQRTGNTRTGCDLPCQIRNEARVESMGFPRGCVGCIPRAPGTRSRG